MEAKGQLQVNSTFLLFFLLSDLTLIFNGIKLLFTSHVCYHCSLAEKLVFHSIFQLITKVQVPNLT